MLDVFSRLFGDIQAGKDIQMVVVNGEVGIGKSRLLEAVLSMAVESDIKWVYGLLYLLTLPIPNPLEIWGTNRVICPVHPHIWLWIIEFSMHR